jgi:DNA-directed RNA polymerase specialized sigma24 family protein
MHETAETAIDVAQATAHIRDEDQRQDAALAILVAQVAAEQPITEDYVRTVVARSLYRAAWHKRQAAKRYGPMPSDQQPETAAQWTGKMFAAVRNLPELTRSVIVLRVISEMSVVETAAKLKVSPVTVKRHYAAGLKLLRQA